VGEGQSSTNSHFPSAFFHSRKSARFLFIRFALELVEDHSNLDPDTKDFSRKRYAIFLQISDFRSPKSGPGSRI
jgi:hypothetical protein